MSGRAEWSLEAGAVTQRLRATSAEQLDRYLHLKPFGDDAFGRWSERAARFFGTPQYIVGQTIFVVTWVILNVIGVIGHWDPYPFILLNLAFSTQAAYAAPLILLAAARQAERDKAAAEAIEHQHEVMRGKSDAQVEATLAATAELKLLLEQNTELTRRVAMLAEDLGRHRGARWA